MSNHRIFATFYDRLTAHSEHAGLAERRSELLAPLRGNVVEIGAGTGTNLEYYGGLSSLLCVEPDAAMRIRLERRIALTKSKFETRVLSTSLGDATVPLATGGADAVVSTLVLCSVRDVTSTLDEVWRILRPGGSLILIEHVRNDGVSSLIQTALTPLQRVVAGGCHLNRDLKAAVVAAGFEVTGIENWKLPGSVPLLRRAIAGNAVKTPTIDAG